MIATERKIVYTVLAMKYLRKTTIISLVVALVSFAGGFCAHPMMTQAASADMVMGVSQNNAVSDTGETLCSFDGASHTIDMCAFDCLSKTPQVVGTKKASIDTLQNCIIPSFENQSDQLSETSFGVAIFSGTHPPAPDILSSVVKIE